MKTKIIFLLGIFLISSYVDGISQNLGRADRLTKKVHIVPSSVETNLNCLPDDPIYSTGGMVSDAEKFAISMAGITVTDEEESQLGHDAYKEMRESGDYKFINSGFQLGDLQLMLKDLLAARRDPSAIRYAIHLIDSEEVNAFTLGGHIYVYTGIIEFANSESAIASIIGHEIGHNEKGHINLLLTKIKLGNSLFGGFGDIGLAIQQTMTPFFNQQNEVEVDAYGTDLCHAAGYNAKKGLELWKKMGESEGEKQMIDSFLRSHPYSNDRYKCMKQHIENNYE